MSSVVDNNLTVKSVPLKGMPGTLCVIYWFVNYNITRAKLEYSVIPGRVIREKGKDHGPPCPRMSVMCIIYGPRFSVRFLSSSVKCALFSMIKLTSRY